MRKDGVSRDNSQQSRPVHTFKKRLDFSGVLIRLRQHHFRRNGVVLLVGYADTERFASHFEVLNCRKDI